MNKIHSIVSSNIYMVEKRFPVIKQIFINFHIVNVELNKNIYHKGRGR